MMNTPAITSIVRASEWTPLQRLVMLDVVLGAEHHDGSTYRVLESSATAIASRIGCSVRIASDALHALVNAGVIEWHRDVQPVGAVNRYGERIGIRSASRDRGDFVEWQHTSVIAVNPTRLETLPETLPTSTNTDRARRRAAAERDRVKRIEHELNELLRDRACPDCNAVGTLHASVVGECTACGQRYRADELDAIIDGDDGADHVKSFHVSACTYDEKFSRGAGDAGKEESAVPSPGENFSRGDADAADDGDDDDRENFSRGADDLGDIPERLSGADAITFLSSIGVAGYGRMISRGGQKQGAGRDWLDVPLSASDAIAHLHQSSDHLVGVLPEYGDVVVIDIDAGLSDFFALHPVARSWCRVVRSDAPDRAKLFVRIVGTRPKYSVRQSSGRKIEILSARRSAVIAGIHPDGMPYELVTGRIDQLNSDQLCALIDAFIPNTPPKKRAAEIGGAAGASSSTSNTSTAKRAIAWWCSVPSNIAQVERLIEESRTTPSGRHFALRHDDRTPSTSRLNTRYVYDHGSGTTYDLFDVWLILTDQMQHKRTAVHDVYRAWCDAGRP